MEPLPGYLQFEPVGRCNLRCPMCAVQYRQADDGTSPGAFCDWELFREIVDNYPGLEHLHLQGLGEPALHPRFFDMVRYASDREIRVSTNTNLTLLTRHTAGEWAASGLETLHVSVDGATAETYERIRVGARFEQVVHNLDTLLAARKQVGRRAPRLHLVMVIMRQNLADLLPLVRLAHRWQADELFVQHLSHDFTEEGLPAAYRPMRQYVEEQTLLHADPEHVLAVFTEAQAIAAELGVRLRLPNIRHRRSTLAAACRRRCDWPWTGTYVSYDGYVMPCCMVSTPDRINFGQLGVRGIEAVWNNASYRSFRSELCSDLPPAICQACAVFQGIF